ncbi:nuclear transport factor 2 family protein [Aquimarina sediminis]|uniref:nuclear transport factor 2 family protein n=1 Tax=Aquimarina sediminis TaxID=2070536 RepID=UPI000CA05CE7|nr:nuclear transport factor 2 family protein [Aquimarina sediminis]
MKKTIPLIIVILTLFVPACKKKQDHETNNTSTTAKQNLGLSPLQIVNKRMEAYNTHNFKEFIALYDKDLKIYTYPNTLLGTGSDRLSSIFEADFEAKALHVKILNQITNGAYVINHEIVTNKGKETKYVSIYEVKDGLITSVRFVRDF